MARRGRFLTHLLSAALLAAGCRAAPEPSASPPPVTATRPSTSPEPNATTAPSAPAFHGSVAAIDAATRVRMAHTWRPGCPVGLAALRLVTLDHWGFDGRVHRGELVVCRLNSDLS
ncbi:MAG TPA: hypothetical protein VEO00_05475 [Actinomycetota bacterium]|nr:hypothetical protein [Actinomycetota bacterium]